MGELWLRWLLSSGGITACFSIASDTNFSARVLPIGKHQQRKRREMPPLNILFEETAALKVKSQLQNYFARFCVGPALLPPRSVFERSAAAPEALQNGKITQAADKIMTKM